MSAPTVTDATAPVGKTAQPRSLESRWTRWALAALLAATAAFWSIRLGRMEWANDFYAGAVQAGTRSWKAFLFGSSDAGNSITVDKPPASLWPMELSARIFGLNSWSMLLPQVLIGVASVALLYLVVKRQFGAVAGLIAGAALAITPVATLMFRYNNPDALLVFVTIAAAWAMMRGVGDGRTRWLVLCGALVGVGFLTKQLQVMLVVPGLALAYLIAGPVRLWRRIVQLGAAALALVVAAGWWVALVALIPPADRPYVGGSTDNSFMNLTFGYNGMARLTGRHAFPEGFMPPGGPGHDWHGFGSNAGITRLFSSTTGGQISWLLPAALICLIVGLVLRGRSSRTDERRAQYLLWGGWLLSTGVVLSFMSGMFHDYYSVALAPAVAALVAVGVTDMWARRFTPWVAWTLAGTAAVTAVWSWVLLGRTPEFAPPLRWAVLVGGLIAAIAVALTYGLRGRRLQRRIGLWGIGLGAAAAIAGPLAYSIQTVGTPHHGGMVVAGPQVAGSRFPWMAPADADGPGAGPGGHGGGWMGQPPSPALVAELAQHSSGYTWVAATSGANEAAGYQLATGDAVMPVGGFSGSDPSPTLAQFQQDVAQGRIHYYIEGHRRGMHGGSGGDQARRLDTEGGKIADWVARTFTAKSVDGVTYWDLTMRRS
ncbi:PMT family glycosyltransferase, 4-amino-4-deoxy-L-arabinose transferase [Mycolicibacterium chubuense NBB4]|uniref:PMT family glycosyltransferase, 4-amino-4-deoxy-L-arabinose transferase n=1 Tax=Mycolicibacterium chubuense (strain NBB4) TaxID=710421 RepID=I4BGN1_MYCCN|nr:glycosyltransferase family 39 protein [Mycolicibacterium chubuense]AFM16438.1 PMT family glycosyltransferase, 4-amino-4-deoxy-L-arabinose transferase [Mycolicibacterium chubuense NBB4]